MNYIVGSKADPSAQGCADTAVLAGILAAGLPSDGSTVDVGTAGTAMRFLTALCAATPGSRCVLTGSRRMCERPLGPLVHVLRMPARKAFRRSKSRDAGSRAVLSTSTPR